MKQSRRDFLAACAVTTSAAMLGKAQAQDDPPPNVVIIFLDDSGYGDFRPFGDPPYTTPNVSRLAREGCTYTQFYVPQAVCSASRAALMTGCFPGRTGVFGAHGPHAHGLDPKFPTMGEVLQEQGYRTAIFGKWHLGDEPETRPFNRGFDETCGLMYSNDMWEHHPENPEHWSKHPLQFWEQDEVTIERVTPEDQTHLTTWYTEHAVDFIDRVHGEPFFLYVPHSMPHVPLFCSDKFKGKSGEGLYADVMLEIDWSVGQIMDALERNDIVDNTLVIFTSDNGPWTSYGNHSGTTPFREAKGTAFDGGIRSACIMKYPKRIEAGTTVDRAFCSIDIMPIVCEITGAQRPFPCDGRNVWPLLEGDKDFQNPHQYYPISTGRQFQGITSGDGRWRFYLPHTYRHVKVAANDGDAGEYERWKIGRALYDLMNDPYETENVIEDYPQVVEMLEGIAMKHKKMFYSNDKKS